MQSLGGQGKHYVKMIEWWQFCDQNPVCFGEKPGMVIMASASMPKVRRFNMDGTGVKPMVPKMGPPLSEPGKPPTPPMEAGKPQTAALAAAREAGLEGPGNDAGGPPPIKLRLESIIPKNLVHDALTEESISWYGTARVGAPIEDQFQKYTFPAEGGSRIHMIWTDSPCYSTCWNDSNAYQRALVKPRDRVHRGPAPLARERLLLRGRHPAGGDQVRSSKTSITTPERRSTTSSATRSRPSSRWASP